MKSLEEATAKKAKLLQTRNQNAKHKPSLAIKSPIVLKNASVEETVKEVIATKEEEEASEDKSRAYSMALKEKKIYGALLDHLQTTVKKK